jgi:hypothetical protein
MALDDYFSDPSQDCLARLFDAVNAMDLSAAPILTRHEKIVMRASERKDIFAEKFAQVRGQEPHPSVMTANPAQAKKAHQPAGSGGSYSSFEEGILMRKRGDTGVSQREPRNRDPVQIQGKGRDRSATESSSATQQHSPPSESSFPNAVWIDHSENGTESTTGSTTIGGSTSSLTGSSTLATSRGRRSTDASDSSSREHPRTLGSTPYGTALAKDTHFYHTSIAYKGHQLPIKMPLSTFPEEVGDVCCLTTSPSGGRVLLTTDLLVLAHTTYPNVLYTYRNCHWPASPTFTHQWQSHSSCYYSVQRACHRQAYHIPRLQQTRWPSG